VDGKQKAVWCANKFGEYMVAMLESRTVSGWPDGYFSCFPERYIKKEKKKARDRSFWHITVGLPEKNKALQEKRLRRAAISLRDEGVKTVVTWGDFPFPGLFHDFGIAAVSPNYACFACAAKIAGAVLRQREVPFEEATGVIYAEKASKDVSDLAVALTKLTRYVRLDCRAEDMRLLRKLSYEYGISPLRKTVSPHEILICFSNPDKRYLDASKADTIINLCGDKLQKEGSFIFTGAEFAVPPDISADEPLLADAQLLTLLFMTGALRPDEIEVAGVI